MCKKQVCTIVDIFSLVSNTIRTKRISETNTNSTTLICPLQMVSVSIQDEYNTIKAIRKIA